MADENYTIVTKIFAQGNLKVIDRPILTEGGGKSGISPIAAAITALITRGRGRIKQPTAAKVKTNDYGALRTNKARLPVDEGLKNTVKTKEPQTSNTSGQKSAATGSSTSAIRRQAEARGVSLPKQVFEKADVKIPEHKELHTIQGKKLAEAQTQQENKFRVGGRFDNDLTFAGEVQTFRESASKIPGALSPQADLKLKNFVADSKKQTGEIDVLNILEESGSVEKLTPEITEMKKTQINTQQLDSGVQ